MNYYRFHEGWIGHPTNLPISYTRDKRITTSEIISGLQIVILGLDLQIRPRLSYRTHVSHYAALFVSEESPYGLGLPLLPNAIPRCTIGLFEACSQLCSISEFFSLSRTSSPPRARISTSYSLTSSACERAPGLVRSSASL